MKRLALILLVGACFAQDKPKPAPLPEIPATYQDKFKSLVIKQKDVLIVEQDLQAKFAAQEQIKAGINAEGTALEEKVMAELKLDPKKYTTLYKDDKMVVVEREEKK